MRKIQKTINVTIEAAPYARDLIACLIMGIATAWMIAQAVKPFFN